MSEASGPRPEPIPPAVLPVSGPLPYRRQPPPSSGGRYLRIFLVLALLTSIGFNVLLLMGGLLNFGDSSGTVQEKFFSGNSRARDKIAILKIDGVIMEGATTHAQKQIDRAARDPHVKAVVVRINSPGGSITGSDDLYQRLLRLHNGDDPQQQGGPKKMVASMAALAASGGYYVAMPADYVMAEETTITGSIGVYAAFPNISRMARELGVQLNVIKAGEVKDSGSMFHPMSAPEREMWKRMVDNAYQQFLDVVASGRPELGDTLKARKEKLREVIVDEPIPDVDEDGKEVMMNGEVKMTRYIRRRADGGIFTAAEAKKWQLIDGIGYLDAAVDQAQQLANLPDQGFKVVTYERPPSLLGTLLGARVQPPAPPSVAQMLHGLEPRLWFLAPQAELAGWLAAIPTD